MHYAAGYGHEECVSLLLDHHSDTRVRDANGDVPLHFAAIHGHPMCAYNITKVRHQLRILIDQKKCIVELEYRSSIAGYMRAVPVYVLVK